VIARTVTFAPEAEADLGALYNWVADRAGPTVALGYVERLHGSCLSLGLASERGTRRDDIRPGLRTIGFERRVTIAFKVDPGNVLILRLFYGGQDWETALS
jgi:toxin ParE1/3/4